jgi:arsenate reductase
MPLFPSEAKKIHYNFMILQKQKAAKNEVMEKFREVRNMIRTYSKDFIAK